MLSLEFVGSPAVSSPPVQETKLEKAIREDMRKIREAAGVTQDEVAKLLGWANRGVVSKAERGHFRVSITDYLTFVKFCSHAVPEHPALSLLNYLVPARPRR